MANARKQPAAQKPLKLDFESVEQVLVVPENEDRFITTEREAARACQVAEYGKEWSNQFKDFLSYIHHWCEEHSAIVEAGFVDVGDIGLRVEICINKDSYDFEFDDEITDLDVELGKRFPSCIAEATQIPKQDLLRDAYMSEHVMRVYGNSTST